MSKNFSIGGKVVINRLDSRTPKYLLKELRLDQPRTITAIFYDKGTQHTRYYLGSNNKGIDYLVNTHFRASQLKLWVKGNLGRPKHKRHYHIDYSKPQSVLGVIA